MNAPDSLPPLSGTYARLLVDNHITDINPEHMGRYSVDAYLRAVRLSGSENAMVYACDHNGNCYYPTAVGHRHAGLKGRDIFGEAVQGLRAAGVVPVAYYTATYHNDCARRHPGARIVDPWGRDHDGRYWYTCPNNPEALDFYRKQIAEILRYPVEGLFIDMTFWPTVCCCESCRRKFGRPLPRVVDWDDPEWVRFQRFREQSMADFARELTAAAHACRPGMPVVHQFSPVLHGWYLGQTGGIADASAYASGDFYGGKLQQRLAVKAFDAFTAEPPFEFMTSRCVSLLDHTSTKSDEEMFLSALTTLANGGAYLFIDAINPDGTLEEDFYRRLGGLNARLTPYREAVRDLGGRLAAETGIYFSMESCVDRARNGQSFDDFDAGSANNMDIRRNALLDEVLGFADILNRMHAPWKIVPGGKPLEGLRTLIVPDAAYLAPEECERLRRFVADGGTLLATGTTSLYGRDGTGGGNFALADVLGVDYTGERSGTVTYTGEKRISASGRAPLARARADTRVRGRLVLPEFPVGDPERYASIHSNPPWTETEYAAFSEHAFGKGKALWLAAPVAAARQYTQQSFLREILGEILPPFVLAQENLPESAEITVLARDRDPEKMLCLVNRQDESPVIPLPAVRLSLRWAAAPRHVRAVNAGRDLEFTWRDGVLEFTLPPVPYGEFVRIG